jgi:hypothetical protein
MIGRSLVFVLLVLPACKPASSVVSPADGPDGPASAGDAEPAVAEPAGPGDDPATAPPTAWEARGEGVVISITDGPGVLMDTSAPPPPPGSQPSMHPFLGAACGGDPLACSRAGNLLRESHSTAEFLDRLRAAGYEIAPAP